MLCDNLDLELGKNVNMFYDCRIVMVFMPQSGYVHPDEFFQSVEVVTGDVLGTETVRTWEFNVTAPIRYNFSFHIILACVLCG